MNVISLPILASGINPALYQWETVYADIDIVGTYILIKGTAEGLETVHVRLYQTVNGFPYGTFTSKQYFGNAREWFAYHDRIYGVDTESVINPMLFA